MCKVFTHFSIRQAEINRQLFRATLARTASKIEKKSLFVNRKSKIVNCQNSILTPARRLRFTCSSVASLNAALWKGAVPPFSPTEHPTRTLGAIA